MELGVGALVGAATEAYRSRTALPGRGDYRQTRYRLLREALGVPLDPLDSEDAIGAGSSSGAVALCRSAIVALSEVEIPDPFSRFIEAPHVVHVMYAKHAGAIADAKANVYRAIIEVAKDCLELIAPGVKDRTTTEEDLVAAGLPRRTMEESDDW